MVRTDLPRPTTPRPAPPRLLAHAPPVRTCVATSVPTGIASLRHVLSVQSCVYRNLYYRGGRGERPAQWFFVAQDAESAPPEDLVVMHSSHGGHGQYTPDSKGPAHVKFGEMAVITIEEAHQVLEADGVHAPVCPSLPCGAEAPPDGVPLLFHFAAPLVIHQRMHAQNHGHILHDSAFALSWALELHGIRTRNLQVVMVDGQGPYPYDDRMEIVTDLRPIYADEFDGVLCPMGQWCRFDRVIAGLGGMGLEGDYHLQKAERVPIYQRFRASAWRFIASTHALATAGFRNGSDDGGGVPPVRVPTERDVAARGWADYSVVLPVRTCAAGSACGDRAIPNVVEVAAALRRHFPGIEVQSMAFKNLSMKQQIDLMLRTSLFIAVDGAEMDNLLFMRDGTGIITIGRNTECEDIDNHRTYKQPKGGCQLHNDLFQVFGDWLCVEMITTGIGGTYVQHPPAVVAAVERVMRQQRLPRHQRRPFGGPRGAG